MPNIKLADGTLRSFNASVTAIEVAKSIAPSIAKKTIAALVDNVLHDAEYLITQDASLELITEGDVRALEIIRHSTAHLLAQAVKQLYPTAQVTIGPVIDNGFYYDFAYDRPFTPEDLLAIEKRMHELVSKNLPIKRIEMEREAAIAYFSDLHEEYKVAIINELPTTGIISLYQQGDFTDLCRGPHVPSTSKLKAFKLTKLAGAYWRGDANNPMLQRIYGTAWQTQEELSNYLTLLSEAEKRDHRKLAKQLDLFHLQDEAPGMVFWHHKGFAIWQAIEQYLRQEITQDGYLEIKTPQIVDSSLWQASGHLAMYGNLMFATSSENRNYAIKPMNCPCHVQVFNQTLRSYRDLPLRFAEFGSCHRNEPSGALHGLMRVRGFVQDDAHIFCSKEQLHSEASKFIDLVYRVYARFGFAATKIAVKLSLRPENRVGDDSNWDMAENTLAQVLKDKNLEYMAQAGEGAFYGPKIEFALKDSLNREWQCGTLQLDLVLPKRLNATYVAEDGSKQTPIMLHRAILGSFERFIGILLEHYAGELPLWLAPIQVSVLNISMKQAEYATQIKQQLLQAGLRVVLDISNEKIGYKIREHTLQKIPYLLIIGDEEMENKQVTVRKKNGEDLGCMTIHQCVELLHRHEK